MTWLALIASAFCFFRSSSAFFCSAGILSTNSARDMSMSCDDILAFDNLDAPIHVDHLARRRIGRAVNSRIGAGSGLAGVVAVRAHRKGELQGRAAVGGQAHRAAALGLAGGIDHVAVNLARGSSRCLCKCGQ